MRQVSRRDLDPERAEETTESRKSCSTEKPAEPTEAEVRLRMNSEEQADAVMRQEKGVMEASRKVRRTRVRWADVASDAHGETLSDRKTKTTRTM